MNQYFHVGEVAIIVRAWIREYIGQECTIIGGLKEREAFHHRELCYVIETQDTAQWLVPPHHLRKRFEPGMPWAQLRDELEVRPRLKELTDTDPAFWSRVLEEIAEPGEPITIEINP